MNRAIIIGASSGIGEELARVMSYRGYSLGLAARRVELLHRLKDTLPGEAQIAPMDLSDPAGTMKALTQLLNDMGGADMVVISSGISHHNPGLCWEMEEATVAVNVAGFTAAADTAFSHFASRGCGHLVGISSFRALRGGWSSPAYNASKAYVSNYLEGLRVKATKEGKPITVTDIRPGLVATSMIQKKEGPLVAPVEKAAAQIWQAIEKKKDVAYVTRRYRLVAALLQILPLSLYSRI